MRFFQCMALWAFHKTRNSQFPICTSLVATGSRTFCLRNRHFSHLLTYRPLCRLSFTVSPVL
nr:MAG TPA: hypothetical protein [Bacteriophage sp.]